MFFELAILFFKKLVFKKFSSNFPVFENSVFFKKFLYNQDSLIFKTFLLYSKFLVFKDSLIFRNFLLKNSVKKANFLNLYIKFVN